MMKLVMVVLVGILLYVAEGVSLASERTYLFVDDHHVLYRSGTKRGFHPATNHPDNPLIREDMPWEMAIGWTSVYREPTSGRYQLWYQAYAGDRDPRKSHKCVVCIAESDNGIVFTKPKLEIHDFRTDRAGIAGHYETSNIVLIGEGGYGDRYANSVVFDPRERDSRRRYKMLYTDFGKAEDGREWPGFFAAFSPDGVNWTKSPRNPLNKTAYGGRGTQPPFAGDMPYEERWDARKGFLRKNWPIPLSMSDAADVFWDPVREIWMVYGKVWIQGPDGSLAWKHAMGRVESKDFLTWSKPTIVSQPDEWDDPNTEFHTSPVFHHQGLYFCLNQILRERAQAGGAKADLMHIELMISRDGLRWDRPFRGTPFIEGQTQDFASGGIFSNSTPVILEDEIRFYYGGYSRGATGAGRNLTADSQQSGVGMANIPLDRFAGIRPVASSAQSTLKRPLKNIGQITMKPIEIKAGSEVTVNADAADGTVRLEILNEDGYRMLGYTRDAAVPISGDSLRHAAQWKDHDLKDLPSDKYMLRIHLNNAEIFAVSIR